jgi:membrane protease YdiL (CAAX protease family)
MPTDPILDPLTLFTFGLLALAVVLLWIPLPQPANWRGAPAWPIAAQALGCFAGLAAGVLQGRGLVAVAVLVLLAWLARTACAGWRRAVLTVITAVQALRFALHGVAGFANPVLADKLRLTPDALPFTLYANADTAVVAVVLMGMFCEPIRDVAAWRAMLRRVWPIVLATLAVVLGLAWTLGYVRPEFKWTPYSGWFLASNLLFTCVAEEAFFRGLLLARLARWLENRRWGLVLAVAVSTLLFGAAHAGGGPVLVLLATVAGLFYAMAYLRTGRIEGAIVTHFALNAVHFVAFTYPALAR